jgi:hypothetical protein
MKHRIPVEPEEWLYRRSYNSPMKNYLNPDGTATSRTFKLREKDQGELSVDIKSLTTAETALGDPNKFFLFEVANRNVLDMGLESFCDPVQGNDAHAVIIGNPENDVWPSLLAKASKRVVF